MPRLRYASQEQRRAVFEEFEQRLVMSGQGVAALLPELQLAAPAISQQIITQPLNSSQLSPTTAAANTAAQYGFDGRGQTVAVIDSGIAWDHHALGGGFGQGHKVVGGWDFADNDALPYDSGPAAMHGTHVAGIIASNHERFKGVSAGVDLVSLRVFNDQGQGNLEMVRQALGWVHQNQNSFQNPITTVVMSLGTNWNSLNTPSWAMLETELGRLKEAGIFISVAAGNSFQDYGTPGLSYPAVSQHVVPVASHGASGQVSDFSQRANHALVAPGESIRSTVPNHLFPNGMTNRFMALSGTSMAAPYVAGVSTILRQANEFMGRSGINQELLYQQLRETADRIHDTNTNGIYSRVNLAAALNHIIPDLEGNTAATATQVGTIVGGEQIRGTIGRLDDVDFFSFTAGATGQVRLQLQTTHQLDAIVKVFGSNATINGNEISFAVQAGREYHFSIETQGGIGHYTFAAELVSGPPAIVWGAVSSNSFNQSVNGESVYQLQATKDGILAIQTSTSQGGHGAGQLRLEIYDSQMNRVGQCEGDCNELRLNIQAKRGETYLLKAIGSVNSVRFDVGNSVSLNQGILTVTGTAGNDVFTLNANNGLTLSVNGMAYQFQQSDVQSIRIDAQEGSDTLNLHLGAQDDTVATYHNSIFASNSDFRMTATSIEYSFIHGGAGNNRVALHDSANDDRLVANVNQTRLSGSTFSTTVVGFSHVRAVSLGGNSQAEITGTSQTEIFRVGNGATRMFAHQATIVAEGFRSVGVDGGGGQDRAQILESAGDREINVRYQFVAIHGANSSIGISGVSNVTVVANSGNARLHFFDSVKHDVFIVNNSAASMRSDAHFRADTSGFRYIEIDSRQGTDSAFLFDTPGNDRFISHAGITEFHSNNRYVLTRGVANVRAVSLHGGWDTAKISGSEGNDSLLVDHESATLRDSADQLRRAVGFRQTEVDLRGGSDIAQFQGSQQSETFRVRRAQTDVQSTQQHVVVKNATDTRIAGNGGTDQVFLEELNLLQGLGNRATAVLDQHRVTVQDIAMLEARSVDHAMAEYDLDIVDFQYLLRGNWRQR